MEPIKEEEKKIMRKLKLMLGEKRFNAMYSYLKMDEQNEEPFIYMKKEELKCAKEGLDRLMTMMESVE